MSSDAIDLSKRKFLEKATVTMGGVGVIATGVMFTASMLPNREVASQATVEEDIEGIAEGEGRVIAWQGSPIFIVHRTAPQILAMQQSAGGKDPQADSDRVQKPEWLVVIGVCTHLGCIPNSTEKGWRCPCHGSVYDLSGRVLSGPAPRNLDLPPYHFLDDMHILVGKASASVG